MMSRLSTMIPELVQCPAPGSRHVALRGQRIRFELEVSGAPGCSAFLRTTIGRAGVYRQEIIREVEEGCAKAGGCWHDREMEEVGPGVFALELGLEEVGVFAARSYVLQPGGEEPVWPAAQGDVVVKVQPVWTRSGCSLYGVFPRLFHWDKDWKALSEAELARLDETGWTVIPPSGKLKNVKRELPHIITEMGFKVVLFPPIFPTPTSYGRMGRYGSPFAPLDFFAVDPALADFDRRTTPLEQFTEVADAIHARGARVFIDVPINHSGWASRMQVLHPEWFRREEDGAFKSPGAWGVVWTDLVELNYDDRALWLEMAEVFLFWCRRGVDGFRCDAGYMLPTPVWEYVTAKVRSEYPDTVFFLEGLGGDVAKTLELLGAGGLDWAYSELFQNYSREQVEWYLREAFHQTATHGLQIHFAETHDNNRLAVAGRRWTLMRAALSALCSANGGWGITTGVEWLATEKINVHGWSSINWGAEQNIVSQIAALNALLAAHPAFHAGAEVEFIMQGTGPCLAIRRTSADGRAAVLVLVNLDGEQEECVLWRAEAAGEIGKVLWCSDEKRHSHLPIMIDGLCSLVLQPGEVLCMETSCPQDRVRPAFLSDATSEDETPCQHWRWPEDARRVFTWMPGLDLRLEVAGRFRFELEQQGHVVACGFGEETARIPRPSQTGECRLKLTRYVEDVGHHSTHGMLLLEDQQHPLVRCSVSGPVPHDSELHAMLTNGRGAMAQVRAAWGGIRSQYDSYLAANLDEHCPVDRRMLFARCRAWVVRRGFSTELSGAWQTRFAFVDASTARWEFLLPVGEGKMLPLHAEVFLHPGRNAVSVRFLRSGGLADSGISLILRADVEDRGFHDKTVLSDEALDIWARATVPHENGCDVPLHASRQLKLRCNRGRFTIEPERVEVSHPVDADRGLGGGSHLYSPGFFRMDLVEGEVVELTATTEASAPAAPPPFAAEGNTDSRPMTEVAQQALRQFLVKRDEGLTVIAGYPWFLDWGRDTLIGLRGIIAAGWLDEAREILKTFAAFEHQGTLPNMIRGNDASNRDTSDAPLWFFVAVNDLLHTEGHDLFLKEMAGGRTIREVLLSIANHYIYGTPNGIVMDRHSGLVYSPPHFTWMDTNHPPGTPREGYPISLQAKWHAALMLLARVDDRNPSWNGLAEQVRASLLEFYTRETDGSFLSDCLHAPAGIAARDAMGDDHLRPDQLFAITLGAITPSAPLAERILDACESLLIPGAIRTLADRPVRHPLPVHRDGVLLNNPLAPFWPEYRGDEDTRRKPAYHNGTAWPWPMPSFAEAMLMVRGSSARPAARALLAGASTMFEEGCLGHLPEIADGGAPHHQRGCGAQAWSVSEWLRVWKLATEA